MAVLGLSLVSNCSQLPNIYLEMIHWQVFNSQLTMQNVDWVVEWSAVLHKVVKAINTTKSSQEWGGYYNYHLKQENTYTNWRGQLSQHPIDVALKVQQRGFF